MVWSLVVVAGSSRRRGSGVCHLLLSLVEIVIVCLVVGVRVFRMRRFLLRSSGSFSIVFGSSGIVAGLLVVASIVVELALLFVLGVFVGVGKTGSNKGR